MRTKLSEAKTTRAGTQSTLGTKFYLKIALIYIEISGANRLQLTYTELNGGKSKRRLAGGAQRACRAALPASMHDKAERIMQSNLGL